ncbi:MAG: PBSX family phage terminase large subunit [Candidatus Gastranaerophilales bacterium]|nr:PBSX family phage terminase large subunit [Candidatus Gastranaerophilales bacterium]
MMNITCPEILNIPPKLYPFIFEFNNYSYFLLEGGRASGKTQSVARFILYISQNRRVRICCGREIQSSINESVRAVFVDLIEKYKLPFDIKRDILTHKITGSSIFFKGFREQGKVNIKGLEGIDILWIDEAQSITKPTLDVIVPTIRKKNSVIIFTMNRYTRFDSVYEFCANRDDCLHININYFDNPFVDEKILNEASVAKSRNINDYNHIWLGYPLSNNNEFLLSSDAIDKAINLEYEVDSSYFSNSIMSVDLSASGADLCVAKLFVQQNSSVWLEKYTKSWSEADTDITKGKIVDLYSTWAPRLLVMDADGLGYPIWISVQKMISNAIGFRGAKKAISKYALNARADGYLALKDYIEKGYLKLSDKNAIRQLEYIKKIFKPNGVIAIQDKKEIRKLHSQSPDFADCVMMAFYAINYCSNSYAVAYSTYDTTVEAEFEPFD